MPTVSDQAVVLRLSDYSETSQIASLFTAEHGLVRLIAKGARRTTRDRVSVGLDLLEYGDVSFAKPRGDATLGTLTEWRQLDAFTGIRRELVRQHAAYYAAELIGRLNEEYDPRADLFAALATLLMRLSGEGEAPAVLVVRFQDALLRAIGYSPRMRQCAGCGRPRVRGERAHFSSAAGGMVCRDCETRYAEKIRISPAMLDGAAETQSPTEWFALLDYHLTRIAGAEFRTSRGLGEALRAVRGAE